MTDPPTTRAVCPQISPDAVVASLPRVGGLHHRYEWRESCLKMEFGRGTPVVLG